MNQVTSVPIFEFGGLPIQMRGKAESLAAVANAMEERPVRLFFINAHCVAVASQDAGYREAVQRADFVFNDGAAIEFAAKLLKAPLGDNLNGTDWIPAFFDSLTATGATYRLFFLGSRPEVVEGYDHVFSQRWPGLELVGSHHGYFEDESTIVNTICQAQPDILLVGMGVPKQELFLDRHWPLFVQSGVRVGIAGGAIFDFITGQVPRAPSWMRRMRLEWLYRIWMEPKRLAQRYFYDIGPFTRLLLKQWFRKREEGRQR